MREFEILREIERRSHGAHAGRVALGPGDDMAHLRLEPDVLVAVDQIVDGRHVTSSTTPLALIGRKAVTRCLSDVAAMAGRPRAALAACVLPPRFDNEAALTLFESMRETAEQYDAPLVGGDLAVHATDAHPLTCSVTILAAPGPIGPVRREGARVGDGIYVTGEVGGSLDADGGGAHLTFVPRISAALHLAETLGTRLHAMIDTSDGLGRDAGHLARASGVAIALDAAAIPCRAGIPWSHAIRSGEDYELLFAVSGDVARDAAGDVAVTRIGEVVFGEPGAVVVRAAEQVYAVRDAGWEHHA